MSGHPSKVTEKYVKDLVYNYGVWEQEDSFTETVQQDAPFDSVAPIGFGSTKTSPNGLISWDNTNKWFNILKSGAYLVKTRQRCTRVGAAAGVSELFIQGQVSLDNGATWITLGNSIDVKLDDDKQVEVFFDFAALYFVAGMKVRQIFGRSADGTNYGSLVSATPSSGLIAAGMNIAPSSQITLYKLRDFNYI